ncbi:ribulose-phosphate 3-epimerase [Spiroplasma clarkii]|uniref:Ribulose-phosphate 3-epimerase n=1 Tax=Spiroplasma clarkii TaxID=2139 RepID=A0A1Y0L116_9MOLU|nr:ribulose-phosphate 3-epimerase [Spiroplasma clarkii]ARU91702.1 ribulose-phosphate 3-epimerase [Spiroplasma clarkii]ATX71092.1 ribulose-phosphate 3-epimerase [Spiroplasma clarkii]
MQKEFKITPSIMTCDVLAMRTEIKKLIKAGITHIHFDLMDGHFVNNLGLSIENLISIKKEFPELVIDAHCMINNLEKLIEQICIADYITFHLDSQQSLTTKELIEKIKTSGCKVGLGIDLATNLDQLDDLLSEVDLLTIMSIKPGFAGQEFEEKTWTTIKKIKQKIAKQNLKIKLQIDGGVRWSNINDLIAMKLDFIVVGSLLFKSSDYQKTLNEIYKN